MLWRRSAEPDRVGPTKGLNMKKFKIEALASSAILSGTMLLASLPASAHDAIPVADEVACDESIVS
jgi:hypothetical protein